MIRSLHFEMKRKYEQPYRDKLAALSLVKIKGRNIGFTLARIKCDIVNTPKS